VEEKKLLDNERLTLYEFVFPPGFKGDEHEAPADEFAFGARGGVRRGDQGQGQAGGPPGRGRVGPQGAVHYSVNESKKPARVLVVLLKER
jgi:quercetin dioxygenase-like cupin family protein